MSYILDALKKNQAQQAGSGVAVKMDGAPPRGFRQGWWIGLLAAALLANAGVLIWFLLSNPDADDGMELADTAVTTAPASSAPPQRAPVPDPRAQDGTAQSTATQAQPAQATGQQAVTQSRAQLAGGDQPATAVAPTKPLRRPPAPERIALAKLPPAERSRYEGFSFTSHIYTDDPSLCAVVIDGQRLQAGDAFSGLKIVEITETGVVFEEQRRDRVRHVAVSPFE